MKKIILLLFLASLYSVSFSQNLFQLKISKPYCIFNFLETANNSRGTSSTLNNYISSNTKGDTTFGMLCRDFKNIRIDYNYKMEEFPENRKEYRSTRDLIIIALVNSDKLEEFRQKTIGILPNCDQQKLVTMLKTAETYYDRLIWNDNEQKLKDQLSALQAYTAGASLIFNSFRHFYNSSWTSDIPFVVALYPIPGKTGNSTATPHANSLCVGVLTEETDHTIRMCVALHEMCHVLYDEQPKEFQHQLEEWFADNSSPFRPFAHSFFDEGMATALGNGWAYYTLTGETDSSEWYNNEYINGYAKVLYPLVEEYLGKQQQMDQSFVTRAIELFAARFPNSITDYAILLNHVNLYSDDETEVERNELINMFGSYFRLSDLSMITPILDKECLESLRNSQQTQLIIIDRRQKQTIGALKKIFPQLSKFSPGNLESNSLLSFYDKEQRPVIVLIARDRNGVEALFRRMKEMKNFDMNKLLQ